MKSIVQEQRKITESCLSFSIRFYPLFLDDPHQHPFGLIPDFLVNEDKRPVGNGRTTPPFSHSQGIWFYVMDALPGMKYNIPFKGIAVCFLHAMQQVFGFDPSPAGPPFPDDVFSHG
jgi:hypothetical protein